MRGPLELARGLLHKAHNDMIGAEATLQTGEALDVVCFHAQQAVEKSLKALLAAHGIPYPFTHDLGDLLDLLAQHGQGVGLQREIIEPLTEYAVAMRYDDTLTPSEEEAQEALETARGVIELASAHVASVEADTPPDGG